MKLPSIGVVTVDGKDHRIHHLPQPSSLRQLLKRELAEKMQEISLFNLWPAERVKDQIRVHLPERYAKA